MVHMYGCHRSPAKMRYMYNRNIKGTVMLLAYQKQASTNIKNSFYLLLHTWVFTTNNHACKPIIDFHWASCMLAKILC